MTLIELVKIIKDHHKDTGVPYTPQTSVVSPLFPGQFNYCLDEIHWYERYGDFVHMDEEHFQKMQPAIRMADFYKQYEEDYPLTDHLGVFSISTINGAHVVNKDEGDDYYRKALNGTLRLLSELGLDKKRLKVTYFSGNDAKSVEMSRKEKGQEGKVLVDYFIPQDNLSKETLLENGINESQIEGNSSRDNFLTTNWYLCLAPWGYRNEFLYRMENGRFLDIATIERLIMYPEIERRKDSNGNESNYVIGINEWDKGLVIDAGGIERLSLACEDKKGIYNIDDFKDFRELNIPDIQIEASRILHRVFSDSSWDFLSRQRKNHLKTLMSCLENLPLESIKSILKTNGEIYSQIFPELACGIDPTLENISQYRKRKEK